MSNQIYFLTTSSARTVKSPFKLIIWLPSIDCNITRFNVHFSNELELTAKNIRYGGVEFSKPGILSGTLGAQKNIISLQFQPAEVGTYSIGIELVDQTEAPVRIRIISVQVIQSNPPSWITAIIAIIASILGAILAQVGSWLQWRRTKVADIEEGRRILRERLRGLLMNYRDIPNWSSEKPDLPPWLIDYRLENRNPLLDQEPFYNVSHRLKDIINDWQAASSSDKKADQDFQSRLTDLERELKK